jgi:tetratricopeptide (TPR) repeat protein
MQRTWYGKPFLWIGLILLIVLLVRGPRLWGYVWRNAGSIALAHALSKTSDESQRVLASRAESLLENAGTYLPFDQQVSRNTARAMALQGRETEAMAVWQETRGMVERFIVWGNRALQEDRYQDALQWYERAAKLEPESGNRDIWYGLGQAHLFQKNSTLALDAFQNGLEAKEGRVGISALLFNIGQIKHTLLSPTNLDEAWSAYDSALRLHDYSQAEWLQAETHQQRGRILSQRKQWEEAGGEYQQVLALNPRHYWAHIGLAGTMWQTGKKAEAIEIAQRAVALDPEHREAYWRLGNYHRANGNVDRARAMFERMLELDPQDSQAHKALDTLDAHTP